MVSQIFRGVFRQTSLLGALAFLSGVAHGQAAAPSVLFKDVRVFDGTSDRLSAPTDVLIEAGKIAKIAPGQTAGSGATVVAGGGRTLMPGLIDAHVHMMFSGLPQIALLTSDLGFVSIVASKGAEEMLMRGFTSVRDLGGPVFGLKRSIDMGITRGPRIFASGAFISQTGGHGDFRLPSELPAAPGSFSYAERIGAAAIADDEATVRLRAREQLALGASQIKLMAGGGIASSYDPLDVTQYTEPELRAAVEAAENWGTYVAVHAYTPRAVQQAIRAGVKCIDHGQLLDEETVKMMAEKGVWWSLQPFVESESRPSAYPEGSPNRIKQLEMYAGTDNAYALAKKYKVKTAWGTDNLFNAENARLQNEQLAGMTRWYTPAEILRMATSANAELLELCGLRNTYPGKIGVIAEGALADVLLVEGNPLENIAIIKDPGQNLKVIMKGGVVYKNTLR